jgi:hypothetical protein
MRVSCWFLRCKGPLKVSEKVQFVPSNALKGKDMSDLQQMLLTQEQKSIAEGFIAIAKDLQSYKAAIARLAENQEAEHAKMLELGR